MSYPKISVVMPSFNQGIYIEEAINSVINQDYDNFELIVVDGGSTDGAVDIIRKCDSNIAWWVSEKDRGQSHAINKGISVSSGDIVTWLNSDDILLPGTLTRVAELAQRLQQRENLWIIGGLLWINPRGQIIKCTRARAWWPSLKGGIVGVFGPSSFLSRDLLKKYGYLDENFHYMMDTELWVRLANKGIRYSRIDGYMWALRHHPAAKMSGHYFPDSPLADNRHPSWDAKQLEYHIICDRFHISRSIMFKTALLNKCRLLTSAVAYRSFFESIYYRGQDYRKLFD